MENRKSQETRLYLERVFLQAQRRAEWPRRPVPLLRSLAHPLRPRHHISRGPLQRQVMFCIPRSWTTVLSHRARRSPSEVPSHLLSCAGQMSAALGCARRPDATRQEGMIRRWHCVRALCAASVGSIKNKEGVVVQRFVRWGGWSGHFSCAWEFPRKGKILPLLFMLAALPQPSYPHLSGT